MQCVKDCSTCKNNVEFPSPHTCDIYTSLGKKEEYEMWEAKEQVDEDIIEKIIGFDIHVLTQKNEKKTLSFSDFKNEENSEISISKSNYEIPYYKLNLHIECNGYGIIIQPFNDWVSVEDYLPKEVGIIIHCFVEIKHKESDASFRTMIDWNDGEWKWSNGRKLSDKYEVLAWQKIKYPEPYTRK